ncbi:MAG: hypothetical protein LC793_23500, partial [Thermomicrobia bacterium]|nr:hypothetical protein [Thermomicrobia bacterium]
PQPSPAHFFYAGPYTPLYTAINAVVVGIIGPTYIGGRIVQLLATLAVAVWIGWVVARSARGRLGWVVGGWAALLLLTWHLVVHWSVMVRPDMTALVWNLAGVTLLRRWWDPPGREGWRAASWPRGRTLGVLAVGAGCFALGWWTKQTFVIVPLAFVLALLPYRPKVAATLAGLYAAMIGLSFGLLMFFTAGGFFQKTYYYQLSWTWHAYVYLAQPFAQRYGPLLALACLAVIFIGVRQRRLTFTAWWFALTCLKTLAAGTDGGNHNHFLEVLVVATLLVGQGVAMLISSANRADVPVVAMIPRRIRSLLPRASAVSALVGLAVVLLLTGAAVAEQEGKRGWLAGESRPPTAAERRDFERVAAYVAQTAGPVYGDNVGLGILAITGHTVAVTDPFTMAAEVRMGRWDDSAIVANVVAGRYRLIVLRGDVATMDPRHPPGDETPGLIRAMQKYYHVVQRNTLWLYAPNP